jgi:hypothetical protein
MGSHSVRTHWKYQYYGLYLAWWWRNEPKHVAKILNFNIDYQCTLCHWRKEFTILSQNPTGWLLSKRFCLARVIKWLWLCYNWCEQNSWNGGELNKCDGGGSVTVWGRCGGWSGVGSGGVGGVSTHGTSRWRLSTIKIRNYRGWRRWCERTSILSNKLLFFFLTRYAKEPFMYLVNLFICLWASQSSSFPTRFLWNFLC